MFKQYISVFFFCFLFTMAINAQGQFCADAEPFCAGGTALTFPNSHPGVPGALPFAEAGIDYSCGSAGGGPNNPGQWPFPSWYFLQVDSDGDLNFTISQTQNADGSGGQIDVDFIVWGPFTGNSLVCDVDLTNANKVDCSWLPNSIENMDIFGAQAGEIYLAMITNFDAAPGFITLQQTNAGAPGSGGTDCSIVNSINLCDSEITSLDATTVGAVTYEWFNNGSLLTETGPILNNVVTPSAIYDAIAYNTVGNIVGTFQFNVNFLAVPIANTVPNQFICDNNNDGLFDFNFPLLDATVLGTQSSTDFTVSYHNSLADAQNNASPITGLYTNAAAYIAETIFVRIENNLNTDCVSTTNFDINVFNNPTANPVDDQLICDDNNDGFWDFDLDALRSVILGAQTVADYSITFHSSIADADANTNPLPDTYTNLVANTQETITVRIENNLNPDCYETTDFIIDVFNTPTANIVPSQLICDDDNDGLWNFDLSALETLVFGTQATTDYQITFHNSQNDADTNTGALVSPYTNQVAYQEETLFVRIENVGNFNCFDTSSFIIDVFDQPILAPFIFELCDDALDGDDTNGFVAFNLPTINAQILGIQDPTQFTVTYHFDQVNADANTNPLASIYTNTIVNTDQIIVRVENNDNTDCYETTTVNLVVNALPVITNMVELLQCDNDTDGISSFNLTESEVLISTNAVNETFTYYTDLIEANAGTNAITNPLAYDNTDPSSNPDVLFVRVENADTCFRIAQLDLFVSATQIPSTVEILYEECDTDAIDNDITNGITSFDFSDAELQIRALSVLPPGQNLTFTYYETEADALAEINAIPDISDHRNDASPFEQEIYVRVDSDVDNACVGLGIHVRLRTINPTPNLDPDDIILCDDVTVGDLIEVFDLTQNETYIFNGDPDVVASYHFSFAEANSGINAIPNPAAYSNTDPTETIFVRVTNTITNCYAIVDFDISVNPLPDANVILTDLTQCENNTDFFFDFDLESKTLEILNGQDPSLFSVTYHDSQTDADNLVDALASPFTNTINPQQIFVAITNNITTCSVSSLSFNLEVVEGANFNSDGDVILYEICDEVAENDGFAQFDFTTQDAEILDGQDPAEFTLTYHDSFDDAFNNTQPLPTLYENLTNPQIIHVRVSNNISPDECFEIGEITLQVNLLPIFDLEDEYVLCITSNDGAVVDIPPVLDTELSDTDYTFEWSLNGTVLPTETAPSLIPVQGGTYAVTVTDVTTSLVTMCTNFDTAEVIESGIPDTFNVNVTSQAFTGNNVIIANASGNSTYEYSLDNGPWETIGEFEDVTGGEHVVAARDINGCGIITQTVLVIDYPKYFTPNGDGNHDTWNIDGIFSQPSAVIYIFDRYGKLLKQLSPTDSGWDGTFNGNLMPTNDYWFSLEYVEPTTGETKNFSAHFTLKR